MPQIPSPPLPVSSPLPISPSPPPVSPTHPLCYRAAMIRLRAKSPSTSHPLPLPPPIILPHTRASMVMIRVVASADVLEVTLLSQKRLCIAPGPRYEIRESSSAPTARPTGGFRADYGFVGTLDVKIRRDPDREIGYGITDVWEDADEIAEEIPATDVVDNRLLMSGKLNLLRRDRRSHARMDRLVESEARASREAWVQSMDVSDTARSETIDTARRGTDAAEDIEDSYGSTTESA
ncbi:hypothetical protein Tco_1366947 [Tanacetum coccineum]